MSTSKTTVALFGVMFKKSIFLISCAFGVKKREFSFWLIPLTMFEYLILCIVYKVSGNKLLKITSLLSLLKSKVLTKYSLVVSSISKSSDPFPYLW
ncbi:hypothetical protein ONA02_00575 [Mycoplasmopsis felis]|uniref:hypothetical protein n=1 Tax=Mycoplasmopsis felis TaxID=33923 RepID=UPI0021AF6ED4|nr:hypothetical protein [Mycoplasmopsis felis]UWW00451.1 hypothetical protein NW064_04165 [Mycoplasmopsis felis]WAM02380.1 hypothetical protein ONA02_00575 [Mycoplasmopsis felis]